MGNATRLWRETDGFVATGDAEDWATSGPRGQARSRLTSHLRAKVELSAARARQQVRDPAHQSSAEQPAMRFACLHPTLLLHPRFACCTQRFFPRGWHGGGLLVNLPTSESCLLHQKNQHLAPFPVIPLSSLPLCLAQLCQTEAPRACSCCSGKALATTMETHGLSREADSVFPLEPFGPWRACCRCWQAIGDPCGDDLDMHGGICNLGFVFERCLNCDGLCHFHGTWDGTACRALPCQVGAPRKLDHLLSASVHLQVM